MAAARHVFTYGTLLFPEVMAAVTGRSFAFVPATLAGFARVCVRGAVYPAARAATGAAIEGVLYRDVDAQALARLDRFEGELYERCGVRVRREDGTTSAAQVYVVPRSRHDRLDAHAWDIARFRQDHLGGVPRALPRGAGRRGVRRLNARTRARARDGRRR